MKAATLTFQTWSTSSNGRNGYGLRKPTNFLKDDSRQSPERFGCQPVFSDRYNRWQR